MNSVTTIEAPRVQVRVETGPLAGRLTPPACVECAHDWEHCHDTAVVHASGLVECVQGDCELAVDLHAHTVSCDELISGCDCDR